MLSINTSEQSGNVNVNGNHEQIILWENSQKSRTEGIGFPINSTILLSVEALMMKLFEDNLDVDSSSLWVELGRCEDRRIVNYSFLCFREKIRR